MSLGVEGCPGIVHTAFEMCHVVDFPPSAMMTDRDAVDGKVAAYLRKNACLKTAKVQGIDWKHLGVSVDQIGPKYRDVPSNCDLKKDLKRTMQNSNYTCKTVIKRSQMTKHLQIQNVIELLSEAGRD